MTGSAFLPWLVAGFLVLLVAAGAFLDARRRRRMTALQQRRIAEYADRAAIQANAMLTTVEQQPERRPFINAGEWSAGRMYVAPDYWRRRVVLSSCSCARCRSEIRKAQAYDALLQRWSPHETGEATQ